jgi:hypothetical protein
MKIGAVLNINEHMIDAFTWISDSFERLRNPALRREMLNRVSVAQAARAGRVPLNEVLYVLNLTAGEDEKRLLCELELRGCVDSPCQPDSPSRPQELLGLRDDDAHVVFVDVIPRVQREEDPQPAIMHGLTELRDNEDVLLVRHVFDPVAIRGLFASRGFASWAEERQSNEWYIYFYRPTALAGAAVDPSLATLNSSRTMAAGA